MAPALLQLPPYLALASAAAVLGAPAAEAATGRAGQLRIAVSGGGIVEQTASAVGIWANSPNVEISVVNESPGFYNGTLKWRNVPAGSYLISGRGVAEAATNTAGSLVASLSLAGGGRSRWRLEPNLSKDYRFAVSGTVKSGLGALPESAAQRPHFAVQLGGMGVVPAMSLAETLDFPSYLLPGVNDSSPAIRQRLGASYQAFGVGADRFLLLDNRNYSLGTKQLEWVGKRLQDFRLEGARQVFVFMHRPPVDPRRNVRNGLANKAEARRLARLLKTVRTAAIFSGQVNRSYTRNWHGFKTYMLAGRDVMVVETRGGELSVRLAIH
ncbi:MAG: hypothetical protein FJZ00_06350 [Candidatus Sericytochromatia bacterium]|uniref:Calcineurin-like phosphoesterase domain-containing protein n=1 Tax=Candidatus Tanganyikabacteria bacterium TaxID=2961651 RepID=A0A937X3S3_9BACT|nr:hypothetical protein [Candidatus Tanganyikabacteria bacterium]